MPTLEIKASRTLLSQRFFAGKLFPFHLCPRSNIVETVTFGETYKALAA